MLGNLVTSWVLGPDVQMGRRPSAEVHQSLRACRVAIASGGTPRSVALQCCLHDWIGNFVIDDGQAVLGSIDRCPFLELCPVQRFARRWVVRVEQGLAPLVHRVQLGLAVHLFISRLGSCPEVAAIFTAWPISRGMAGLFTM